MGLYDEMEAAASEAYEPSHPVAETALRAPQCPDAELVKKIQRLAQTYSIEILPKSAGKIKDFAHHLPQGTRVFIPFLPGAGFRDCVPLAIRLRQEGMEPVPHIAARRLTSRLELTGTLARLGDEAKVRQCLVIAGDPDRPVGPYAESADVLETGLLEQNGMDTIYVGGQPEGIANVSREAIEAALIRKNDYAQSSSASLRLISQFTLNIRALMAWRERLGELGNTLPLHVGIAGPTSLTTLLRFAALTGASASIRAMRRYGAKLTQLASEAAPDALIAHLAGHLPQSRSEAGQDQQVITGLHVYTFGGFLQSVDWLAAVGRGDFELDANGRGFKVSRP